MSSVWELRPELRQALLELRSVRPTWSASQLAAQLSLDFELEPAITKDAVQKVLRRERPAEVRPRITGAIDLADAVERQRSGAVAPEGFAPSSVTVRETESDESGSRRTSVTYRALKAPVERVETIRPIYLTALAAAPTVGGEQLIACLGDTQFPFEDPEAWRLTLSWIRDVRPGWLVLTGDIADCYSISRFANDPRLMGIQDELRYVHARLVELRSAAGPDARISWIAGNHEARLQKWLIAQAPALVGVRRAGEDRELLALPNLVAADTLGIEYIGAGPGDLGDDHMNGILRLIPQDSPSGGLLATHGFYSRAGAGGASIQPLVDRWGESVVGGHDHSQGIAHTTKGGVAGSRVQRFRAISTGFLANRNLGYNPKGAAARWAHGFAVISVAADGSWAPELVEIADGQLAWRGQRWG